MARRLSWLGILLCLWLSACQGAPVPSATPVSTHPSDLSDEELSAFIATARAMGRWQQALLGVQMRALREGWTVVHHRDAYELWRVMGQWQSASYHARQIVIQGADDGTLLRTLTQAQLEAEDWVGALRDLALMREMGVDVSWATLQTGLILAPSAPLEAQEHLALALALGGLSQEDRRLALALLPIVQRPDEGVSLRVGEVMGGAGYFTYAERAFAYAGAVLYPAPEPLAYWALMRAEQGEPFEVVLTDVLERAPESVFIRQMAGLAYRSAGDLDESLMQWQMARGLAPEDAFIVAQLATTHGLRGDVQIAQGWYEEALRLAQDRGDEALVALIGRLEADMGLIVPEAWLESVFTSRGQSEVDMPNGASGVDAPRDR